jgi:pentatricopeptide repeat protein
LSSLITEDSAGYVFVSGFNENASNLVLKGVKIGDRILAVGSAVGDIMWPVSTVEGVVSACTARFPGQKVTMRFERPSENLCQLADDAQFEVSENTPVQASTIAVAQETVAAMSPQQQRVLLQRCREVLKRYWSSSKTDFVGKNDIPVMVADKVVDAVASASGSFDAVTLSMVMNAYLSCDKPDAAIHIFEASTGFRADGAMGKVNTVVHGKDQGELIPTKDALNLYTASSVMHAFAMKGDLASAKRILAAIEGYGGLLVGSETVASWPGTGVEGSIQSDTVAYNTALAAAVACGVGFSDLMAIFSSMRDPKGHGKGPAKDIVSYNTVIAALGKAGRSEQAFEVFSTMKQNGIKPDTFTYTSLVKSCSKPIDMQELLYDMKELGAKPDIVTYNTIIKTLCDRLQWYEAKKMIIDMESNGVVPNSMTYGFLMTGLVKAGKHSACLSLFESACADSRTMPLTENVHLYTTAISAAASLKNHEKAFHLVNRMKAAGVRPNMKTMSALMGACLSSNMTSLAVEVYKQMEIPDGLAMSKGLEAMSAEGNFDDVAAALFDQWSKRGNVMSGKQIMDGYTVLMRQALVKGDMDSARKAFHQFLRCGYIPSKVMYRAIIEGMGLVPPRARDLPFAKVILVEHFRFLLFVLDAIRDRNLPCDGGFYASLLHCSSRMGGLGRKLGSLLTAARAASKSSEIEPSERPSEARISVSVSWEDLMLNYDEYKESKDIQLPRFAVNINKDMVRQVLNAEQLVTHKHRRSLTQRKIRAQNLAPFKR